MHKLSLTHTISDFEKGPIRRSLFSNGAVSLFHHAKGFSGAVVQLHFIAGSMFEKESEQGLAHLIEHLFFKEQESRIIEELELAGASVNAYTYKENVCFELSCNAKKLDKLLPLFLQKFFQLSFTDAELVSEKKVIIQELKEDLDDHETQAIEEIFSKNFSFDYGHKVGGSVSSVKNYKHEDIERFFKKFFSPERMMLVVVSGKNSIKIEDIYLNLMNLYYTKSSKKPFRLKGFTKSKPLSHFKKIKNKKIENALLMYSFDGPALNSKDYYDFVVLDDLMFQGLNSLFFQKLRIEKPLIYGLGSSLNSFSKFGIFLMIFNSDKKNLSDLKKSCEEVFEKMKNELIDEVKLNKIKERILDGWELSFDDLEERAEFIAGSEIYQLEEFSLGHIKSKIKSVSAKSVYKTFNSIYNNGYTELIYKPTK